MDKTLEMAFRALKYEIDGLLSPKRLNSEEELREICYKITGCKENLVWHIYFNLDKFRDGKLIFNPNNINNINNILRFGEYVDITFNKIGKISNVDPFKLKLMFNDYLISNELRKKRANA